MNKQTSACTLVLLFAALIGIVVQHTSASGLTYQGECSKVKGPFASCACQINGSDLYVNLAALRHISLHGPRFTTSGVGKEDQWHYSYNPCSGFSMFKGNNGTSTKACNDVAVARWTDLSAKRCYSLGPQSSAKFVYKWPLDDKNVVSNLTLKFEEKKDKNYYAAVISLVCNRTVARNQSLFKYINNTHRPHEKWYFLLESECCCPGLCGVPPSGTQPAESKFQVWKIIVIVVCACLFVFLIILLGFCLTKKRKGYQNL